MRYNNTGKTFISFSSINGNRSLFEIIFELIVIAEADCKNSFWKISLFWKSRSETNREVAQNFNFIQQNPFFFLRMSVFVKHNFLVVRCQFTFLAKRFL